MTIYDQLRRLYRFGREADGRTVVLGRKPFAGTNPVDPFCGLEDARY